MSCGVHAGKCFPGCRAGVAHGSGAWQGTWCPEGPRALLRLPVWWARPPCHPLPSAPARLPARLHPATPHLAAALAFCDRGPCPQKAGDAGAGQLPPVAQANLPVFLFQKGGIDPTLSPFWIRVWGQCLCPTGEAWPVWPPECCGGRRPVQRRARDSPLCHICPYPPQKLAGEYLRVSPPGQVRQSEHTPGRHNGRARGRTPPHPGSCHLGL